MENITSRIESARVAPGGAVLSWFEQSHFLIKTERNQLIHIDPFLSRTVKPENHIYPEPLADAREVDATHVFLTHDHRDHTDPDTLGPLFEANPKSVFIGPVESCGTCRRAGVRDESLLQVEIGQTLSFDGFTVDVVFAKDTGDENPTPHLGYIFLIGDVTIYMTGDTRTNPDAYAPELKSIAGRKPDVMIVPINEGYNNPGPAGASELVKIVEPKMIIPCHFGCFKNNTIDPLLFVEALSEPYKKRAKIMTRGESITVIG